MARIDTSHKILFKSHLPKPVNTSTSRADRGPWNPTLDKMSPRPSNHAGLQELSRGPASALARRRGGNPGITVSTVSFLLRNREGPGRGSSFADACRAGRLLGWWPGLQLPFPIITQGPPGPFLRPINDYQALHCASCLLSPHIKSRRDARMCPPRRDQRASRPPVAPKQPSGILRALLRVAPSENQ